MVGVLLVFAFLACEAHSQIYGPGPLYPGPWNIDPGPCGPCAPDVYGPFGPYGVDPYGTIPATIPSFVPIPQPIMQAPIVPCNNLPAPSFVPNQIQPCANLINQPVIPPCPQPLFTNVPQLTPSIIPSPVPQCTTSPPVVTTIVDNTLANSLANAIQLLIVSNLIENTLGSSSGCGGNILAQALGSLDNPCVNNFELISPDFYPTPQVISCESPSFNAFNPCINEIPCYQNPVVCQSPCDMCNSFGTGFGSSFSKLGDCNSFGYDNCGPNPIFGTDICSNPFGSPVIPSYGCLEPAVPTIAPVAVEVPFPAAIPAQMICNFGYLPTNVPCVSVNVEPLPFESFNNMFGNFGNYIC